MMTTRFLAPMGRHDWYRNTTWTPEVQAAFRSRLDRSRGRFKKAQYLRIQALYLAEAALLEPAIQLLNELLGEYPEPSQLSSAMMQRAQCFYRMSQIPKAIDDYRRALQAERDRPIVKTDAWLKFAWMIASERMAELYDEALAVLAEFSSPLALLFPLQRFQYNATRALIVESKGDRTSAQSFAAAALKDAATEHSGFSRHPTLGIARDPDEHVLQRLKAIASAR
jgi:tetratricopeptide (TPR) repeat protein